MDPSEQNSFSVEKSSEISSGPYTSPPPPIGYPTREAMVGDPPAVAVETTSKGVSDATLKITECIQKCLCGCLDGLGSV
ncbi:hypothetical protein CARUB_v10012706mg [Capsella rubella]|uniref:Cysteine-rich transmembrane CYSTM domain-containing protein n=1 Tax=Capsella rubella TaxID=81985 RepID=R0ETC2_9BRAS|nr:cysteine-rich and transmembrane domain-containing protein PCC1 [Capsella rubella]EOA11991.1 hypothetical protein CARUB_v10012706mg [Capsella rubella]